MGAVGDLQVSQWINLGKEGKAFSSGLRLFERLRARYFFCRCVARVVVWQFGVIASQPHRMSTPSASHLLPGSFSGFLGPTRVSLLGSSFSASLYSLVASFAPYCLVGWVPTTKSCSSTPISRSFCEIRPAAFTRQFTLSLSHRLFFCFLGRQHSPHHARLDQRICKRCS
jgi:hypothetical protein